jgi:hypothetical protein
MVTILSWVVLSNHCALGGMQTPAAKGAPTCCGMASLPLESGETPDAPVIVCCKGMHAVTQPADLLPDCEELAASLNIFIEAIAGAPVQENVDVPPFESGPPEGAATLAELLIQKSLLSHAPPAVR